MDPTAAAKPAGSVISSVFKLLLPKVAPHFRCALFVVSHAKAQGTQLKVLQLRRALADGKIRRLLKAKDSNSRAEAGRLVERVQTRRLAGTEQAIDLLRLIEAGYLSIASPGEAVAGLSVQIAEGMDRLSDGLRSAASGPEAFLYLARLFMPPLEQDIRRLRELHGGVVVRMVNELAEVHDRRVVLEAWAAERPEWYSPSPAIEGWLGELALESGTRRAARVFLDSALSLGASPTAYWKARRISVVELPPEEQETYLSDVIDEPVIQGMLLRSTPLARRERLATWSADTAMQRAFKAALRVRSYRDESDFDSAIEAGREEYREHSHYGAALVAVECLLRRGTSEGALQRGADLNAAAQMAIELRDARRRWRASSSDAVAHAMRANILLANDDRAWALSQVEPAGEASRDEAEAPVVRNMSIVLVAERGDVATALEMCNESTDRATRLQVEARTAELALDDQRAAELWAEAIDVTEDWDEKANLCFREALHGRVNSFVQQLRTNNPEVADEIELVAALYSDDPRGLFNAERESHLNPRVAHALQQYYASRDRIDEFIAVAERSARQWGSADDMLVAARGYLRLGRHSEAAVSAANARLAGGGSWGGIYEAITVQIESASGQEDWANAIQFAREAVRARPGSSRARWALIRLHLYAGEDDLAFAAWQDAEKALVPSNTAEATAWLYLFRLYGSKMSSLRELQTVALRFEADEQVRTLAIGALVLAPIEDDHDSVDVSSLLKHFQEEFPDAPGATSLHVDTDDPAALLDRLDELAGGPRDTSAIDAGLANGSLPIGIASQVARRSYAATLIRLRQSPRFAVELHDVDERATVEAHIHRAVVIDTSALLTLATIPPTAAEEIAGSFVLKSATQQLVDLNSAVQDLNGDSGGTFFPSSHAQGPRFELADASVLLDRRQIASSMLDRLRLTGRQSSGGSAQVLPEEARELAGPWTASIALAANAHLPLWCDDVSARRVATAAGVPAFGTPAVLAHLRRSRSLSPAEADTTEAALIHGWMIGIAFADAPYKLALQLDEFEAKGAAFAIHHSDGNAVAEKIALALDALEHRCEDAEAVQQWTHLMSAYLARISESGGHARRNVALFLTAILGSEWMSPSSLPFVLAGARSAVESDWRNVLEEAFRAHFRKLVDVLDYGTAGHYARSLVAAVSEADRLVIVGIILER